MNRNEKYIYGETFSPEPPHPTADVYKIASLYLSGIAEKNEAHEVLNDAFKALVHEEPEVDATLEKFEREGVISREDTLLLTVLLATSRSVGPDLDFLRNAITTGVFNKDATSELITRAGMDHNINAFLQGVIDKIGAAGVDTGQ